MADALDHGIDKILLGLSCILVNKAEHSWHLIFGERRASLNLFCPWRLLVGGRIAFGDEDHDQQFGLPSPIDGEELARRIISPFPVIDVKVTSTADIAITFENGAVFEAFNHSGGYEGWTFSEAGYLGFEVVALGGGRLEIFDSGENKSRSGSSSRYGSPVNDSSPHS